MVYTIGSIGFWAVLGSIRGWIGFEKGSGGRNIGIIVVQAFNIPALSLYDCTHPTLLRKHRPYRRAHISLLVACVTHADSDLERADYGELCAAGICMLIAVGLHAAFHSCWKERLPFLWYIY